MSRDWEQTFRNWGKPPSQSEREKCDNAERAIRKAISTDKKLKDLGINVFPKGSYYNNTNARLSSDVDICVLCPNTINFGPRGITPADIGLFPATYHYSQYRSDVHDALVNYFGYSSVTRRNKAFSIHANTYRVDADVVACFIHRLYYKDYNGQVIPSIYIEGNGCALDNGESIINWSNYNYIYGVEKNKATARRYKAIVRIIKHLRNEMINKGYQTTGFLPSYPIECLVWNVPNVFFGHNNFSDDVRWVLIYLWFMTLTDVSCKEWREVNKIKFLFQPSHQWTREQANKFFYTALSYIGFT